MARGPRKNSVLAVLVAVAFLASGILLFAQNTKTGTASLGVQVAPAVQLTTNGTTSVSLWIRLATGGTGSLWGDSTNTCTSPITGATTYSTSGEYNNIPLSSIPFTSSNNYVCAYNPTAAIPSAYVVWPHTPASLKFSTQPTNTTSAAPISPAVTVQVLDSNGLLDTGSTASVTISITSGTGTSGATLSGTLTQSAVNGVATFNNLSINKAGTAYTLTASSSPLTGATSSAFNISAGAATKLAYTTVPSTGTAGTAFSVTVQSQDAGGNPVSPTSNTTITLSKASGGGTLSGTLTGSIPTSGNSVTISTPVYSKSDTMTLTATATAGETSLTPVTSGNIVFSAGAATQLAFTTQPSTTTAGSAVSPAVTIQVRDVNGNLVTTNSSNVTIAISSGGVLSGGSTLTVAASGGVATFSNLVPTRSGSFTLSATDGSLTGTTSSSFTVNAAAANKLVWGQQPPSSITRGTTISPAMTVFVEDQYGNLTSSASNVVLTFNVNFNPPGSDAFKTGSTTSVGVISGTATFSNIAISGNKTGSGSTFTATLSGIANPTVVSSTFAVQ
ncbi:beta strand repeat-containing protein [Edaphobacter bradus]|uniref:beta strand repeat-containing protein n=1 Tax=Edaphobacter bradus TaxID=2259016 RepID=UPI0021E0F287|nr:hypothetical protein [Edaphobacter bradus]